MSTKINISDYLSEQEMKEIATEQFKASLKMRDEKTIERIFSNSIYGEVENQIDRALPSTMKSYLEEKIPEIINDMSFYSVFSPPSVWDKEKRVGYRELEAVFKESRQDLLNRVGEIINDLSEDDIETHIAPLIADAVIDMMTSKK